ncbi:hypothetical protein [Ferruginibacter sp.]|nr:hypothetical protein [Ferruginibacter sp.]
MKKFISFITAFLIIQSTITAQENLVTSKATAEIQAYLTDCEMWLMLAITKAKKLAAEPDNYQYNTGWLLERCETITAKLKQQKQFLDQYFASKNNPARFIGLGISFISGIM